MINKYLKTKVTKFVIPGSNELEYFGSLIVALIAIMLFTANFIVIIGGGKSSLALLYPLSVIMLVFIGLIYEVLQHDSSQARAKKDDMGKVKAARQLIIRNTIFGFMSFSVVAHRQTNAPVGIFEQILLVLAYFYTIRAVLLTINFMLLGQIQGLGAWRGTRFGVILQKLVDAYERAYDDYQIKRSDVLIIVFIATSASAIGIFSSSEIAQQAFVSIVVMSAMVAVYRKIRSENALDR